MVESHPPRRICPSSPRRWLRPWNRGITTLVAATSLWYLFERAGYNLLSFAANALLLFVSILFFWAKSASLLNRPVPPLPGLEVSEESVVKAADAVQAWINLALSIAGDISVGRNLKLLAKVVFGLWVISYIGSLANFLTFVYIGVILTLSVPVVYNKYQDHIDDKLSTACMSIKSRHRKIDDNILRKIGVPLNKEKKSQ